MFDGTNVGIGTTSPSTYGLLAAVKNATGVTTVAASNSNTATNDGAKFSSFWNATEMSSIGHYWNGGAFIGKIYSYGDLTFLSNGATPTEYMRLTASGNVGIGTSSPASNLHISGAAAGGAIQEQITNTDATGFTGFAFTDGTNVKGQIWVGNGSYASFGGAGSINYSANSGPHVWYTNYTERLRIASAGQIGIGGANYGTSGQVLTSGGSSAAPTWSTPSGVSQAKATALSMILGF